MPADINSSQRHGSSGGGQGSCGNGVCALPYVVKTLCVVLLRTRQLLLQALDGSEHASNAR